MNTKIKSLLTAVVVTAVGLSVSAEDSECYGFKFSWEVSGNAITITCKDSTVIPDFFMSTIGNKSAEYEEELKNPLFPGYQPEKPAFYEFYNELKTHSELILDNATELGESALTANVFSFTSVTMPKVETIGAAAFCDLKNLKSLTLPPSVKNIYKVAFSGSGLTSITFEGATPPEFGTNVFRDVPGAMVIYVPAGSGEAYKSAANFGIYASQIYETPIVKVDSVDCGDPWSTITVGYTLNKVDADIAYKVAFDVTANGVTKGTTNEYAAAALEKGKAYSQVIDTAALFGAVTPDTQAKVKVSLIAIKPKKELGGVQLWAGGPFFAECNVGATKPEEAGYYFWWGDTVGYTHDGMKWVSVDDKGTSIQFKNTSPANTLYGKDAAALADYVDAYGNLKSDYDAATAHLGAPWRMMTKDELVQLAKCPRTPINTEGAEFKDNGDTFAGCRVSGQGDYSANSIFLPAAGNGGDSSLNFSGKSGGYWSSTPYSNDSNKAYFFNFDSSYCGVDSFSRYRGYTVRAVRDAK